MIGKDTNILIIHHNAMKGEESLVEHSHLLEERRRPFSEFFFQLFRFRLVFQKMCGQRNLVTVRQVLGGFQELRRAGVEGMGFYHDVDERMVGPPLNEFFRIGEAFRRRLEIGGGKVEEDFAEKTAHTGLFCRLSRFLLEDIHIGKGCGSRLDHLGTGQHASPVGKFGIHVTGFSREDVVVEPVHQFPVVGYASETGHGRMGVGVDQPRHDDRMRNVDCIPPLIGGEDFFFRTDSDNRISIDGQSPGGK